MLNQHSWLTIMRNLCVALALGLSMPSFAIAAEAAQPKGASHMTVKISTLPAPELPSKPWQRELRPDILEKITITEKTTRDRLAKEIAEAIRRELVRHGITVVDKDPDLLVEVTVDRMAVDSLHGPSPVVSNASLAGKAQGQVAFRLGFEQKPSFWRNFKEPEDIGVLLARQILKRIVIPGTGYTSEM